MSKLRIINQPLRISDLDMDELEEEIHNHWDHRAESMAIRNEQLKRKTFNVEV